MARRWLGGVFLAAMALLAGNGARAGYYDDLGKTYAIQQRKYNLQHEITPSFGFLPLDAFEKYITFGGSYIYHLNDFFGLQLVNFHYAVGFNTGLKDDLVNNFGVSVNAFDELRYYATVAALFKPFYGKMISFNKAIVHGDVGLTTGGGMVNFKEAVSGGTSLKSKYRFCIDLGAIGRVFLTRTLSLRLDIRNYIYFKGTNVGDILDLGLGLAFNLGGESPAAK
jgi:outer membrane beta-barrel protein